MSKNIEIVLATYNQANKDANEMLRYIECLSLPKNLSESNLPSLVRHLEDEESNVSRIYTNGAAILGGGVAATVGASISTSLLARSLMLGGKMAIGGAGLAMIPGLNIYTIPMLALPLLIKTLSNSKIKKYIKENEGEFKKKKERMQKGKEKLLSWLSNIQKESDELDEKIRTKIKEKFTEYTKKTKKFAEDISIQIDDCINLNTNKRILQYNEVILKQYRLQKDLEEKVDFLFAEYNNLLNQKQELERQVNCLVKLLSAMGCPEAVINQALNESEA